MRPQEGALPAPLKGPVSCKGAFRIFLAQTMKLFGEKSLDREQPVPHVPGTDILHVSWAHAGQCPRGRGGKTASRPCHCTVPAYPSTQELQEPHPRDWMNLLVLATPYLLLFLWLDLPQFPFCCCCYLDTRFLCVAPAGLEFTM